MDPRQSRGMTSPRITVRLSTAGISAAVTYPYQTPLVSPASSTFAAKPFSGTKRRRFPAYLCPPVWLHPRTATASSAMSRRFNSSRMDSMSAGPQTPHLASRFMCVHTKRCARCERASPASSPDTTARLTKSATTAGSLTASAPSLCLRICGNMITSPASSPVAPLAPVSERFSFTLPTAEVPGLNW